MNNPEQKALKKLASQSLSELQMEARRLEGAATAVFDGRVAHGTRIHRQRVKRVLDQKLEDKHYREEKDIQRHLNQQESSQARYDEGYDQGDTDFRERHAYAGEECHDKKKREGYYDGFSGKPRKRILG